MSQRSGIKWILALSFLLAAHPSLFAKSLPTSQPGFLKALGEKIIDPQGHEVLLRCIGLGDWLLPEGYMWQFEKAGVKLPWNGDRPRSIEKIFTELVGEKKASEFWKEFHAGFVTEADVKRMKELGFNSVRPALNARVFMTEEEPTQFNEENFKLLDRFIGWCEKYKVYVILDLHGAPGGQTGENIDDSPNTKPELYNSIKYQERTVKLWKKIAERYHSNPTVIAYDLLNEPIPEQYKYLNPKLAKLYKRLIREIRTVDRNHMITLEGAHYATDWSIFDAAQPPNVFLQFHKYWNGNDQKAIQQYLDKRAELNIPIWCGESGENKDDWYRASFKLLEDNNIGWCFWTWKKLDSKNNPYSITPPKDWKLISDYAQGGSKPDKKKAEEILWEFLKNMKLENCVYHASAVNAVFHR